VAAWQHPQHIARLTPLSDVLARIDARVATITPRAIMPLAAPGPVLADDVTVQAAVPAVPRALRDGIAVRAESTSDASAYAPVAVRSPQRVNVGDLLPSAADAVVPLEAAVLRDDGSVEIVVPVAAGEGVLPAGGDAAPQSVLLRRGHPVRHVDWAALAIAGIRNVTGPFPNLRIAPPAETGDAVIDAIIRFLDGVIGREAGVALGCAGKLRGVHPLCEALQREDVGAVIGVGGTGTGADDDSVVTLASRGEVVVHGIAIRPGETAAFGIVGRKPVLLLPGRFDAAVAAWLLVGEPLLARLRGVEPTEPTATTELARKIASPLGLTEVVPVRRVGDRVEPIASGYIPLRALTAADGWVVVPPDSEGYQAGARVVVRPFP
jgi:molybdopterin biosynthesis enzyme